MYKGSLKIAGDIISSEKFNVYASQNALMHGWFCVLQHSAGCLQVSCNVCVSEAIEGVLNGKFPDDRNLKVRNVNFCI